VSFVIIIHFKNHKMTLRILLMSLHQLLSFAQSNSQMPMPTSNQSNDKVPIELKRNALYNLDEIKVRWKKAALENCTGVPCTITTCTVAALSSITLACDVVITPITIATTGASGIGTATSLPPGITASWSGNAITLSGKPTTSNTFTFIIPLTGSCGSVVNATGTIIVTTCPM